MRVRFDTNILIIITMHSDIIISTFKYASLENFQCLRSVVSGQISIIEINGNQL